VDRGRIRAERRVVQEDTAVDDADVYAPLGAVEGGEGADRVLPVEAHIAREVVSRAKRDGHEGEVALDGQLRDRRQRAVAAGDAHHVDAGLLPVEVAQLAHRDPA
jgi:hypothetical protein